MIYRYETIKALAKDLKRAVTDLLALAPQNDPFYMGTETDRTMAAWFADVYQRAGCSVYRPQHLRRLHYWALSMGITLPNGTPYENTEKCWEFIIKAAKAARYLELVPLAGIVDNKNPQPHVNAYYYGGNETSYQVKPPSLESPDVDIYGLNPAEAQPYHLEIWCEKSTMNDVLLPVCRQYGANLVTFEGEVSITSVCVELMRRVQSAGGKPVRIWYISDFDPAGNSMPVAMSRKIEFMARQPGAEYDIKVKPLALTAAQVSAYNLPRTPIKEGEKRAGKFESAFGSGAVELDALEALHPGQLASMVRAAVDPYFSVEAAEEIDRVETALRQAITDRVQAITARYSDEIAALQTMIEELEAIDLDASAYTVERFAPHVAEDSEEWLFDSERGYLAQIEKYAAHKGKSTSLQDIA